MQKKTQKVNQTNLKDAIVDIAKGLESVFKKYSRATRKKAWDKITSKKGEKEIEKILVDPNRQVNTFQKLANESVDQKEKILKFSEWIELKETKNSKTKSGKKVPAKYLSGLNKKGKYGSEEAMKKEIDKFRGKSEYKLNWDADYKDGKRIKTKKGSATKAFEKRYGR